MHNSNKNQTLGLQTARALKYLVLRLLHKTFPHIQGINAPPKQEFYTARLKGYNGKRYRQILRKKADVKNLEVIMKSVSKSIQVALILLVVAAMSSCSLGQTAEPTATAVDVNAVMTSAAATAFVQLTDIAAQASPTTPPTQTPTPAPTPDQALLLLTPTLSGGGLPVVVTSTVAAGLPITTIVPSLTPFVPVVGGGGGAVVTCFNSKYIADVTITDGTVMKPNEKFQKVWRIQNTGTCKWDEGFGLVLWAGPAMNGTAIYFSGKDKPVEPNGIVDLGIYMVAPAQPGEHTAHWTMIDDQGKTFGGDLTVAIKVVK